MSHIFASVSFGSLPRNRTFRARDRHGCARSGLASSLGAWTARPLAAHARSCSASGPQTERAWRSTRGETASEGSFNAHPFCCKGARMFKKHF